MNKKIRVLHQSIRKELSIFKKSVKKQLKTGIPFIDKSLHIFWLTRRQYTYPSLVFLSANMCSKTNDSTYKNAILIFLLENCLLSHNRVDNSFPFYAQSYYKSKNKIGTLLGDFFLAQGLRLSVKNQNYEILTIISQLVQNISEAKILEQSMRKQEFYDLDNYLQLIKKKSGDIFAESCHIGGLSVKTSKFDIQKLKNIGLALGIAFGLQNDLKRIKPKLYTRKNYLITLPCLYAFKNLLTSDVSLFNKFLNQDRLKTSEQRRIFSLIKKTNAIAYTLSEIQKQFTKAKELLSTFETNPAQKALLKITDL